MSTTKHIQFTVTIKAPASLVWQNVICPERYRQWTSAFAEGSHFKGSWDAGAKILFLASDGEGMVSEIAENRPNEFISIRHLGYIANGVEDTTSDAVRAWAPAFENYTFLPVKDGTNMIVDQDVTAEWEKYIAQAWPKALEKLKEICEAAHVA